MNLLLNELKIFSRENFWVYIILLIALTIVYITGKGNIIEIILLFFANFLGNIFIMVMQKNYTDGNNKIGSIYQITSNVIFTGVSLYGYIYLDQAQYIVWQLAYILASVKNLVFFNFDKELKILNEKSFIPLNLLLFVIFIKYFGVEFYSILQAVGFCLITTGLVSIIDKNRYWLNVVGIGFLTFGSLLGVISSFNLGNLDGIALGYFALTGTVFIYYLKLIKKYI
ncbi:MAG: hypothetical protein PHS49_01520 [Candidatus Gracilibacteria bacterium]|nr:hypothetical protein [Candidatus Gracilibacteria bacterium]